MVSGDSYRGLKYRIRGDASPQGRPRVYFCCHPDDFSAYFEPVAAEILGIQTNAAIWYYDPSEGIPDGPEFLDDLRGMQLFVIPVTSRFVYRESRAREVELPLAVEAHVPVLPIMQEDIPNRDFSEACGSLQTLNRYTSTSDPTAIPYEEKLRRFLQSVLVGDELAERVRAAFDAYVFLSYRKKDRAQAQRIMRLIHENELCRDIAIWYDEFLIPGEDFHDAIHDALMKCSVFSLVVTPHLLEPGNFVMREEYPAARDSGKPVVPVEAVETDHRELSDAYEGIGDTVPADDRDGLSSRMLDSLRDVALRENDGDPRHNYLVGLAYLTGIDVEVDHDRAFELIASAAEAGLPEAYERLVAMYNTGEGVERDYHRAIEWQERLVEVLRDRAAEDSGAQNRLSFLVALSNLGDYRIATGDFEGAFEAYVDMLCVAELLKGAGEPLGSFLVSQSFGRIGDTLDGMGDPAGALALYERSLGIYETFVGETGTARDRRELSVALGRVGNSRDALGDPAGALALYERSLAIREALASETGTMQERFDLSTALNMVGRARQTLRDWSGALEAFDRSLAILETLVDEEDTVENRRGLLMALVNIGDVRAELGDAAGTIDLYRRSLEIAEAIANETGTVEARRNLSVALNRVGGTRLELGDAEGAITLCERSLEIAEAIANETGTVEARRDLSVSFAKLGSAQHTHGDLEGALESYRCSLVIREALAEETDTVLSRRDLSCALSCIGDVRSDLGDSEGALLLYQRSLVICAALAEETGTVLSRRDLSAALIKVGKAYAVLEDRTNALESYNRLIAVLEALASETRGVRDRRSLSVALASTGDACNALGDKAGALEAYERSLAILKVLADEEDTVEASRDLSVALASVGRARSALGDQAGALKSYKRSLAILGALAGEVCTVADRRGLSVALASTGDACNALGDKAGALEAYERSLAILKVLTDEEGTVEDRRAFSMVLGGMGDAWCALGDPESALEAYERAHAISEVLAKETGTVQAWDDLALSHYRFVSLEALPATKRRRHLERMLAIGERLLEQTGLTRYESFVQAVRDQLTVFGAVDDAACLTMPGTAAEVLMQLVREQAVPGFVPVGLSRRELSKALASYAELREGEEPIAIKTVRRGLLHKRTRGFLCSTEALYSDYLDGRLPYDGIVEVSLSRRGLTFTLDNGERLLLDFGEFNADVQRVLSAIVAARGQHG